MHKRRAVRPDDNQVGSIGGGPAACAAGERAHFRRMIRSLARQVFVSTTGRRLWASIGTLARTVLEDGLRLLDQARPAVYAALRLSHRAAVLLLGAALRPVPAVEPGHPSRAPPGRSRLL